MWPARLVYDAPRGCQSRRRHATANSERRGGVRCGRRAKRSRRRHPHHHRAGPRRAALSPASQCDGASSERSQGGSSPRADRRGGYGARASASDPLLGRAGEPRQPSAPAYEASGSASRQPFNTEVIEQATTPSSPVSPRPVRNALIALALAALLAVTVLYLPVGPRRSEDLSTQRRS